MKCGLVVNHGLYLPEHGNMWDAIRPIALAAEEGGFDSLWSCDHVMWSPYPGEFDPAPLLEVFVEMGAIAAVTRRIQLGHLVLGVTYRNPALVAKMATTLDQISHGRFILGLGAAWMQREHDAYGWEFPPPAERVKRLEEAVKVALALWSVRPASFEGRYYRLDRALNDPPPVRRPRPPILIGGGEKVTLRIAAQYADYCNFGGDPDRVAHKIEVVKAHCRRLGRPFDDLTVSWYGWVLLGRDRAAVDAKVARLGKLLPRYHGIAATADEMIERFRAFARLGVRYVTIEILDDIDVEPIGEFAQRVLPALREL